jgi:hypothetical protein
LARVGAWADTVAGVGFCVGADRYRCPMSSAGDNGKVRYTYRLRVSGAAERLLLAEWDRCRWVWNQCVEASNSAPPRIDVHWSHSGMRAGATR